MKKLVILLILLGFTLSTNAQNLIFNGIPLNGTGSAFKFKLEKKGFIYKETIENILVFTGSFISKPTDRVLVVLTPKTKQVWKVVVFFTEKTTWYSLKDEFTSIKDQLILKYGTPEYDYHFFSSPYEEDDGYEMSALKLEKCHYYTSWTNGISLEISKYYQIKISYEDPTQSNLDTQERNKITQEGL